MSVNEWLIDNGVDPGSVSDELKVLLGMCDDEQTADMLRLSIAVVEASEAICDRD